MKWKFTGETKRELGITLRLCPRRKEDNIR